MRGFNGYWHKVTNVHNCCAIQHPFSWKSCSGNYSRYPPVTVPQQPSVKARDVPGLMSSVVEVMTCKLNPNRYNQHMKKLYSIEAIVNA